MENNLNTIVEQLISNFDFAYMIVINVFTYVIINFISLVIKHNVISSWKKRLILFIVIVIITIAYLLNGYENKIILLNSAILAPVFWSWILKPILKVLKIDYKQIQQEVD